MGELKLVLTIDVEEEGLFSGRYPTGVAPTENVSRLGLLTPVFSALDIRPTLLVTHQVARSPQNRDYLLRLQDKWGAEIGAHLHPWNTPPVRPQPFPEPVPSEWMSRELLKAKLEALTDTLDGLGVKPFSFRMGRFNLGPRMLSILREEGIRVDSSVAPGRQYHGGPSHLVAPADPYFPHADDVCVAEGSDILEVPITIVPVVNGIGSFLQTLGRRGSAPCARISTVLQRLLWLPAQPAWTGLRRLKAAVRLHRRRGGKVVTVFFHSSELMPGGYPGHRTEGDVRRFLRRLDEYLSWLGREVGAESKTLSDLWDLHAGESHV